MVKVKYCISSQKLATTNDSQAKKCHLATRIAGTFYSTTPASFELTRQVVKPTPSYPISNNIDNHQVPPPPQCTWAYFIFQPTSLTALKSLATKTITSAQATSPLTTPLVPLFGNPSSASASPTYIHSTVESTLARAVDVRHYLDISQTYPGMAKNMTYHTYTLQKLVEPLGSVALQLRSALDAKTSNLGHNTRALATLLNRTHLLHGDT